MPKITKLTKPVDSKKSLPKKVEKVKITPAERSSTRFVDKNVKISPRKLRLVANIAKKLSPTNAQNHLKVTNSKSARILEKAIKTAVSDAINNHKLDQNSLVFSSILVNESIKFKRMDKSHSSRFSRGLIQKRHSRLTINILGTKTQ